MTQTASEATTDELEPGGRKSIIVDETPVLLVRTGDDYYAIEDVCTHDGQPLTDGPIADGEIACPRHGARFDLKTGNALCMPATEGVHIFKVTVEDGQIFVASNDETTPTEVTAAASAPVESAQTETAQPTESSEQESPELPENDLALLDALKQVIDPELMINIVDLGLIYEVEQDGTEVAVKMTLTSPACPAGPQLIQQSKMALERLESVEEATIDLVMVPPWTPERMTEEARDQLGIF